MATAKVRVQTTTESANEAMQGAWQNATDKIPSYTSEQLSTMDAFGDRLAAWVQKLLNIFSTPEQRRAMLDDARDFVLAKPKLSVSMYSNCVIARQLLTIRFSDIPRPEHSPGWHSSRPLHDVFLLGGYVFSPRSHLFHNLLDWHRPLHHTTDGLPHIDDSRLPIPLGPRWLLHPQSGQLLPAVGQYQAFVQSSFD